MKYFWNYWKQFLFDLINTKYKIKVDIALSGEKEITQKERRNFVCYNITVLV